MADRVNLTTPVGRILMGSLYKANDKDADGKPLTIKTGANAGQARVNFFFMLAIPKGQEQSWAQTEWGQQIYGIAAAAFPQAIKTPAFAWKIEDGDSAVPNKKGKAPNTIEGAPGHWLLKYGGQYAPKVYAEENGAYVQHLEPDFVKPGYYAQVAMSTSGNGSTQTPGIYLNHQLVLFKGYGPEIVTGVSADEAFGAFKGAALPAGASTVPLASTVLPANPSQTAALPTTGVTAAVLPTPIASATAVLPNPQFLNGPAQVATGPVVTSASTLPTPPTSGRQMTAKANGGTYEALIAMGWTDANLIAHGLMLP